MTADFMLETVQARRQWNNVFKVLKEKNSQPRILYPVKVSFKNEGELKLFFWTQKRKEIITSRNALQEMFFCLGKEENNTRWKYKSMQRNEELLKW